MTLASACVEREGVQDDKGREAELSLKLGPGNFGLQAVLMFQN